jgi:glycosyltransferase involved in cell wall biosynthesis
LGHQLAPILGGFDRLLAYNRYGAEVMEKTLEKWCGKSAVSTVNSIPDLPHGFDEIVWHPRDRETARETFFNRVSGGLSKLPLNDDQILVAFNGTNTSRKDWGLAFQTAAELIQRGMNVFLWGHTDVLTVPLGHWPLLSMVKQFNLDGRVALTTDRLSDEDLAWSYSAADVMLATSSEGFGYVPFQALACGLTTVGTSYAGSSEFTPKGLQAHPSSYSLENPFLIQRPTYNVSEVADKVIDALKVERTGSLLDPKYEWETLWPRWKEWIQKGVQ